MVTVIRVLVAALVLIATNVSAQDFQGVATYKSKTKIDIQLDSTQVSSGLQDQVMEMMKKQFEKTYLLNFNKSESTYREDEELGAPQAPGVQMVMVGMGSGSDVLYKNTKENRYTNQNEAFSKLFLIKDELEDYEWELGTETKNIGEYTCYKATFTREVEVRESGMSINGDKDLDELETKKEMRTTTAWYTPQIPVNNGPRNFQGLPGLILEVNDGQTTLICSKIVLNPKEKVKITEPKKGKEVTQEEFDKIMEKKMKEMEERYRRPEGERDGQTFEIRIGG
ncbi:GLPGLI family protein [Winogradskyella sp. 3972H.M.0a.05]|uniref:GLPGLI family protein n=1 Tax=Winogradskyella sp. 3972H.M.0a.05 TaxID=2950277 RepID=UPI003394A440